MHHVMKNDKMMAMISGMTFTLPKSKYVYLTSEDMTPTEQSTYGRCGVLMPIHSMGKGHFKMERHIAHQLNMPTFKAFPLISETIYNPIIQNTP